MNIDFRSLTTSGPSVHSVFKSLPFLSRPHEGKLPSPVLALQTEGCIKVVGDIHRFENSPEPSIPAYIISELGTMDLLASVADFYSPMNLIEKALLLDISRQMGVPEERRVKEVLPIIDLAPTLGIHDELISLVDLEKPLKQLTVEKDLSLKRVRVLSRVIEIQDWAVLLLERARPGVNVFLEILQNLWEIHKRDELSLTELLKLMEINDLSHAQFENARAGLDSLRVAIHRRRFPTLDKANQDLVSRIDELEKPSKLELRWDRNFEQRGLSLQSNLATEDDARSLSDFLRDESFLALFNQI